jgi:hypothetical protein
MYYYCNRLQVPYVVKIEQDRVVNDLLADDGEEASFSTVSKVSSINQTCWGADGSTQHLGDALACYYSTLFVFSLSHTCLLSPRCTVISLLTACKSGHILIAL